MRVFGLTITRQKATVAPTSFPSTFSSLGGWWPLVREPFGGAWQRNLEVRAEDVLAYAPVYACGTLIASDIAKLRIKLTQEIDRGIWDETDQSMRSPFLAVLEKPNGWQTRIKFLEQWIISKLIHGNTYVLKARDERGLVQALYVLDPQRVRPLVAPNGEVFYALQGDVLAGIPDGLQAIPAGEIIHDVMVPLYHPLCGVSPITACGVAALQGLRIQRNSSNFFANGSQPGGILTAPGPISKEDQEAIRDYWQLHYAGENVGKVAVLGNNLKYEALSVNARDAQLIDQLKWTAENVCMAFHVPPYMIGAAPAPPYNNIEALNQQYYSQCLQNLIESIELLLDEGLDLPNQYGTELDLDALLRMDTATRMTVAQQAMTAGMSPNEIRRRFHGLGPVKGGESPMIQQQNFSLEAIAKRDALPDPFATSRALPDRVPTPASDDDADTEERSIADLFRKTLNLPRVA